MPQYMLLLRNNGDPWRKLSPDDMQKTIEKYLAWRKKPFVVGGAGLVDGSGRVVQKKSDSVRVTEGPFSESTEVMGGYYTIEAKDYDEAVQLSRDNPNLDFGTIEIREVILSHS